MSKLKISLSGNVPDSIKRDLIQVLETVVRPLISKHTLVINVRKERTLKDEQTGLPDPSEVPTGREEHAGDFGILDGPSGGLNEHSGPEVLLD